MKTVYVVRLTVLLIVILFAWNVFPASSAAMNVTQVSSSSRVKTDEVHPPTLPTQMSDLAKVTLIGVIMCLAWHVIAFYVAKSKAGKRVNPSKCMDNCLRKTSIREYRMLVNSSDEESLAGSPMPGTMRTHNFVIFTLTRYILWLFHPLIVIWSYLSLTMNWSKRYVQKPQRVGPRGLQNLGNTCYFNSVMQTLANTYVLQRSIQENKYNGEFSRHFEGFCKWVSDRKLESNSSRNWWHFFTAKIKQFKEPAAMHRLFSSRALRFSDRAQHDSHECLRHLLDELRKEERDCHKKGLPIACDPRKSLTVVDTVFGGHFITVYFCMDCGSPYHLFEPFLDISLPLCRGTMNSDEIEREESRVRYPIASLEVYTNATARMMIRLSDPRPYKRQLTESHYSIYDCLWYFTRTEHIKNEYLCNDCYSKHDENVPMDERLTSATKQTLIFNPPAILTIHLKRFELKPGGSVKLSDRIAYDELLDIAPYCSELCLRNDPPETNLWYSLYGVVVHSGSLEFGHYIAYIKVRHDAPDTEKFLQEEYFDRDKTKDELIKMMEIMGKTRRNMKIRGPEHQWKAKANEGIWFCMNDSWVSEVRVEEVLNQEAYLLLYERI